MNLDSATYRSVWESAPSVVMGELMGPLCHSALDENIILSGGGCGVMLTWERFCDAMWENERYNAINIIPVF